ncbi:MAG: GntR family transcriptional regulator [Clostridiales bacterium]|nr:GntR family transcriptional regulator [Clostridiales bacterium]
MRLSAEEQVEKTLIQSIFGGDYKVNDFLPPERNLAEILGFSRPVIHKAIIRLESKGLVSIVPRQGVRVNDYRESGKLELLEALYEMFKWKIDIDMHRSILSFVKDNLTRVMHDAMNKKTIPYKENLEFENPEDLFLWMHHYAMSSDNVLYAMLFNEFRTGIINVSAFLLSEKQSDFQVMRMNIDKVIQNGLEEELLSSIEVFFGDIEKLWIRRCEDEAQSGS